MFSTERQIDCGGKILTLDRPRVVGIINLTPDSFSDGGRYRGLDAAQDHALRMIEQGADMLDIGGESTRPGSDPVSESEEIARVVPLIDRLAPRVDVPISVDTSKPGVMKAAVAAGAGMINDVRALQSPGAMEAAASLAVPVCLMHMLGEPGTMQDDPSYRDVVAEVHRFLAERIFACEMSGIEKRRLLIDPGFGFGKTLEHNLLLLAQLNRLMDLGVPILAGLSRKAMIGTITGKPIGERAVGSAAAAMLAAQNGALLLRVHDVQETVDALAVLRSVQPHASRGSTKKTPAADLWGDED